LTLAKGLRPAARALSWLGWLVCLGAHAAALPFPVEARAYLVQVNGQTRWERASEQRLPLASLTKLMTALLVMEQYRPTDIVSVSASAARETGTRLGLKAGEQMQVQDLLAASLLKSANDACHALADHVAGSQARFVQNMNQRARTWGLAATHFTNACGHDDAQHQSSARDLARLATRALAQPVLAGLVARASLDVQTVGGKRRFSLVNSNALVGRYEGTIGVKTGFTPQAGKCVIALVQRGDVKVLLVLLNGANRWWDASDILDHAFAHAHETSAS
jgi:D-alanyl-D-alanine carboxypeptidase (penicillin-binding protein 5/6)